MRVIADRRCPGVIIIEPDVLSRRARLLPRDLSRRATTAPAASTATFVQDNHSRSVADTLRGLHWQVRPPAGQAGARGRRRDLRRRRRRPPRVADLRPLGRRAPLGRELPAVFIPPGFAHGFCVLSEHAEMSNTSAPTLRSGGERGLMWDDPAIGIAWPLSAPLLSVKDRGYEPLERHDRDLPTLALSGDLIWVACRSYRTAE